MVFGNVGGAALVREDRFASELALFLPLFCGGTAWWVWCYVVRSYSIQLFRCDFTYHQGSRDHAAATTDRSVASAKLSNSNSLPLCSCPVSRPYASTRGSIDA